MFGEAMKDYVAQLGYITETANTGVYGFIGNAFAYVFHSTCFAATYLFTFQWLTHFQELPATFRQNYHVIISGKNVVKAGLGLEPNFYPILNTSALDSKHLLTGLLNACFLALPCTFPQILAFRSVIINGWTVTWATILGTATGQAIAMFPVLFGLDALMTPLWNAHPLVVVVGLALTIHRIYVLAHDPDFRFEPKPDLSHGRRLKEAAASLWPYFRNTALLSLFETTAIGHYFGNLTFHAGPNVLETGTRWWLWNTGGYWLGLTVGMVLWSLAWTVLWKRMYGGFIWLFRQSGLDRLRRRYHTICVVGLMTMALNSIPYYGVDYLMTGPLGLTYQDHLLRLDNATQRYYEFKSFMPPEFPPMKYLTDNISFDDDTIVYYERGHAVSEELKPEIGKFMPDTLWANREALHALQREREKTASTVGISEFKRRFYQVAVEYPHYDADGLTLPEEEDYFQMAAEVDYLDRMGEQIFREDIYLRPKDSSIRDEYTPDIATHRVFRERCLDNPVYKLLFQLDVLPFLGGEPNSHHVSLADDVRLNQQRVTLNAYLTTLENYKRKATLDTQPWPRHVYNQQFKGSLNLVRMYDAVRIVYPPDAMDVDNPVYTLDEDLDLELYNPETKVLSYDQTLYNRWQDDALGVLHEELKPAHAKRVQASSRRQKELSHLVDYTSGPMYFGWDASLRKLLINTSRLPVPTPGQNTPSVTVEARDQIPSTWNFQAYPRHVRDADQHYCFFDMSLTDPAQIKKLRFLLGFLENQDIRDTIIGDFKDDMIVDDDVESDPETAMFRANNDEVGFFKKLPQYDWAYKRLFLKVDQELNEERMHLEIGNALPPKLDGLAWPGDWDRSLRARFDEQS